MQFGSRVRRVFWIRLLITLILDSLLAAVAAMVFDGGFILFVVVVIGLQVFYAVRWILSSLMDWILFAIHGRRQMIRHLANYLRENRYPEPDQYEESAESYLARVAKDKTLPATLRLAAAAEIGTIGAWRNLRQYGLANRLVIAYEDAIQQHKRTFPPGSAAQKPDDEWGEGSSDEEMRDRTP